MTLEGKLFVSSADECVSFTPMSDTELEIDLGEFAIRIELESEDEDALEAHAEQLEYFAGRLRAVVADKRGES